MNHKKQNHYEDQLVDIIFLQPNKGKIPVGKTREGLICLIKHTDKKPPYIEYHSTWECQVNQVFEKKLIVTPLRCIKTAKQERDETTAKLELLKPKQAERRSKPQRTYQYLRKSDM